MLIAIYAILLIINIGLVIIEKNSKFITIITGLFLVILIGLNTYNADLRDYTYYFNHQIYPIDMEIGYRAISHICYSAGVSYNGLTTVLALIMLVISLIAIRTITNSFHVTIVYFMAYAVFLDVTQLRNAVAVSFYILAIVLLSKKKKFAFAISILAGAMFHKTIIIMLPLFFLSYSDRTKRVLKFLVGCSLLLSAYILIIGRLPYTFTNLLNRFVRETKQSYYITKTNYSFVFGFFQLINIYFAYILRRYLSSIEDSDSLSNRFASCSYHAILFSTAVLPFIMINMNFIRYIRNNNILICIMLTLVLKSMKDNNAHIKVVPGRVVVDRAALILIFAVYITSWIIGYQYDQGVNDVLFNNLLF